MCDGKCSGPSTCPPDTAGLRASSKRGASGRFAVTTTASTIALRKGRYWLHLESGDTAVTLAWSNDTTVAPVSADGSGLAEGTGAFPGGTVGFVEVIEDGLQVALMPSGASADKLWIVRVPPSCSGGA